MVYRQRSSMYTRSAPPPPLQPPLPPPHTHHQAFDSNTRFLVCVTVMFPNPADGLCADRARGSSGSAKRRRKRRLRATLRHERQTVAMELAAALHHSRDVGPEKDDGPRAQKTASSGGRPGVLTEPEPQGGRQPRSVTWLPGVRSSRWR